MEVKKTRVAIITNIITTYRKGFYDRLFKNDQLDVNVFCQDNMPGMNFISIHEQYPDNVKIIKFLSAKGEKIAWQFLPWRKILNEFDVIFIAGNPRVLSDFFLGTYLRIINKNVVLWTMAHSYRSNQTREFIRLLWSRIFKWLFLYTDKEADYLRKKGFKNHFMLGMNNGLDQKNIDKSITFWPIDKLKTWQKANGLENKIIIVSSARLELKNKFELVLKAMPALVNSIPNIHWCLIGGGNQEFNLKNLAGELGIKEHVTFVGSLYEEKKLAPYFLSSVLFIHPAAIGLSLLHAFGYGLPVIVHGKSHLHSSEYGAFQDGLTGCNFIENDHKDLARVTTELINKPDKRDKMKLTVQKIVREQFNVDIMVERFVEMAKYVSNQK